MAVRHPGGIGERQRRRFDHLWQDGRSHPLPPDLIRYQVWASLLVDPVVEVGSGDGLLARSFPDREIVSVDQSTVGLHHTPAPRLAASGAHLPLRSGFARTVVAAEVLEHMADPPAVLAECRRIAAPGATLLVSVPTVGLSYAELAYHWLKIGERPTTANLPAWDPEHERRYEPEELLGQLAGAGWEPARLLPLFGTATTAAMYFAEPLLRRVARRPVPFAHRLAGVDRAVARLDRHSCIAVVSRAV